MRLKQLAFYAVFQPVLACAKELFRHRSSHVPRVAICDEMLFFDTKPIERHIFSRHQTCLLINLGTKLPRGYATACPQLAKVDACIPGASGWPTSTFSAPLGPSSPPPSPDGLAVVTCSQMPGQKGRAARSWSYGNVGTYSPSSVIRRDGRSRRRGKVSALPFTGWPEKAFPAGYDIGTNGKLRGAQASGRETPGRPDFSA